MEVKAVLLQEGRSCIFSRASKRDGRVGKGAREVILSLLEAIKNSVGNDTTLFLG